MYVLSQNFLAPTPEIPMTEAQVNEAREARVILIAALALEETYDVLLSNFLELEQEALCAAAASVVRNVRSYGDLLDVRSTANRRVVNLLTAARMYLDHAPQQLAVCLSDTTAKEIFKPLCSQQYDSELSYRFMDALRNHVQHSGLAVHTMKHASRWTGADPDIFLEIRLELFSEKKYLAENPKFHKKTLAALPDEIELIQASRQYLQGLDQIHGQVRSLISEPVAQARAVLQKLIDTYSAANEGKTIGLSVLQVFGEERRLLMPVLLNWDDQRLKLAAQNTTLGNLSRRAATGHLGVPLSRQ